MEKTLDWNRYLDKAAETVAEGIVMLKNDNNALPLKRDSEVAVFGRIQLHYYKSGTGSGGLVNVTRVTGITDGLIESGRVKVNSRLLDVYKKWDEENPYDIGTGWGGEPWSQAEMPLDDKLVSDIASSCETAIAVIGRTAGEEQDSKNAKGAYLLSDGEEEMLGIIRKHFKYVVVLLNVGGIIDMGFVQKYSPDSVLYVWQGGMTGGTGTAMVLTGEVSPSGKLPDTIAKSISDYPSDKYFGNTERNFYSEDIYVGYRYFETFAQDKVLYPFGFGLSYTSFDISASNAEYKNGSVSLDVTVKNIGAYSGKEVVQIYCGAPQGKLGKPAKVLCGFEKTRLLEPDEAQTIHIDIPHYSFASYDDSGASGYKSCYVLEKGQYIIYAGADVRSAEGAFSFELDKTLCVEKCTQALAPVLPFERMKPSVCNDKPELTFEIVPLSEIDEAQRRNTYMYADLPYTGDKGIKLADVKSGKAAMENFIAQLSDKDLACIVRGEGMGSPKVTPGTASAFGGVTDSLAAFGIPCACCSDGPSGMRLDCGTKAFSLPNGTLIASTFNKELLTELFTLMGREMSANNVDCLLGPGMNIHRHPLNGRNFEYFSEDPYLTGMMATAELKGLHSEGVTGTVKHFCGNNQETNRHGIDSAASERALREIYLKGFEIAVKEGKASTVMTTYGSVNGLWTAGSLDLNYVILRREWGFDGVVMTDWWAHINRRGEKENTTDLAAMVSAVNDVYMVCADSEKNGDNIEQALAEGKLTRGELQRCAGNICKFMLTTHAMDRLCGCADTVNIINRCTEDEETNDKDVVFYELNQKLTISPDDIITDRGSGYVFALDVNPTGLYRITVSASSTQSATAQLPMTIFSMGTPCGTLTFNGTDGKPVEMSCSCNFFSRFTAIRLYFAQSGLTIHSITFENID